MMKRALSLVLIFLLCGLGVICTPAAASDGAGETSAEEALIVPQIRISTADGSGISLQKDDGYVDASLTITDTDGSLMSDNIRFKVRGNTTAMLSVAKKAYTIKFDKKKDVLGLGAGKKWALLANTFDPTMLRNAVANTIARELSLAYTSNRRFVELWVDDSYRGCYDLYEPVEAGKDRVNIDIDTNGGKQDFLIEYEAQRVEDGVTYFTVDGLRFIASEPENPDEEQLAYITGTMEDVVHTLRTGTREQIEEKLDVSSFAKYYILNEYVKTFDFDMSSVYFYYQDGRLYAGPAWDYDLSAGNLNDALHSQRYKAGVPTTGLYCNQKNIYRCLCDKDWFMDAVRDVYIAHHDFFCDIYADGGLTDTMYERYAEVFDRNYAPGCWSVSQPWINIQKRPLSTYRENYDYLKNWYKERNEWLTGYFTPIPGRRPLGDADGDGRVTIIDATTIQRHLAGLSVSAYHEAAADVDRDTFVTVVDATAIQRYLADLPTNAEIGMLIQEEDAPAVDSIRGESI
jgi:hypothetical protein